jgi:hypothetical protein
MRPSGPATHLLINGVTSGFANRRLPMDHQPIRIAPESVPPGSFAVGQMRFVNAVKSAWAYSGCVPQSVRLVRAFCANGLREKRLDSGRGRY